MRIFGKRRQTDAEVQRFVAAYAERLHKTAYRLCANAATAEDLTFRALERAIAAPRAEMEEKARFFYLCKILRNLYIEDIRLKGRNLLDFPGDLPERADESEGPDETLIRTEEAEGVRAAVAQLTPLLREAVIFRYYDDFTVPQIATLLSVAEGTVKFRLHEARRKIREFLTQRNQA